MKKTSLILVLFVAASFSVAHAADGCESQGASCLLPNGETGVCEPNDIHTTLICGLGSTVNEAPIPGQQTGGFTALAPIPGLTDSSSAVVNSSSLAKFFNNFYKYLIGLAAALAVIEIIWGGIEYSTQDSVSKKSDGKERIKQAIMGLILVLSPVLVFSIINPSILNLSVDLPPLNTAPGTALPTQQTPSTPSTPQANYNCTITGTLFKTAICSTQQDAQNFATACNTGSGNVPFLTTDHKATCDTRSGSITGPYAFVDTSAATGLLGYVNAIVGYSHYEPIAHTPTNTNNGAAVQQFATTCTAEGGITCMSTVKLPIPLAVCTYNTGQTTPPNVSYCWAISLSCTGSAVGAGGCSTNPQFTIIQ